VDPCLRKNFLIGKIDHFEALPKLEGEAGVDDFMYTGLGSSNKLTYQPPTPPNADKSLSTLGENWKKIDFLTGKITFFDFFRPYPK
jgi:hypothetical protein